MKNNKIRDEAQKHGVKLWEIAERLNITDGNFSRKLRRELSEDEQQEIFKIIDEISSESGRCTPCQN